MSIKIFFPKDRPAWGEGPLQLYAEENILGVDVAKEGGEVTCSFLCTTGFFLDPILGKGDEEEFVVTSGSLNREDLTGCTVTLGEGHGDLYVLIRRGSENLVELWGM